jgi:hypothetical protein
MTNPQDTTPQTSDNRLDRIEVILESIQEDSTKLKHDFEEFRSDFKQSRERSDRFDDKFSNYQQATQWVVQLAFSLIASATVLVIITTIFKR